MQRTWWKRIVTLVVTVAVFSQHLNVARADVIEVTDAFDSTPCLAGDDLYDPVGDVCAALDRWENDAIVMVRERRGIIGGTDAQLRYFARADVRAELLARMLNAIEKPAAQRTADEVTVTTWIQHAQRRLNVRIAEQALAEFTAYDGPAGNTGEGPGWCTYTPPAPYEADRPDWSGCRGNPDLFQLPPTYPDAETWVKWGAAEVKQDDFTLAGFTGSTELSAAAIAAIAGTAYGVLVGSTIAALTAVLGEALVVSILPYATSAIVAFVNGALVTVSTAAQSLAAATATMFGAAAFVVVVVAVALYGIIYSGLQVFERQSIRTELVNGVANANASGLPALETFVADSSGVAQLVELITPYLTATDVFGQGRTAPGRVAGDLVWEVGAQRSPTTTIQGWDGESHTLEMRSGYLVVDGVASTHAKVVDRDGQKMMMFRAEVTADEWGFVLVPADSIGTNCISGGTVDCKPSLAAEILDGTGTYRTLKAEADRDPELQLLATEQPRGSGNYTLQNQANWFGQDLASSTVWWLPEPATHAAPPFGSDVSVCDPWTDPSGNAVAPAADTERYDGICWRRFATGASTTYTVPSNSPVKIRASVTSPSGRVGNDVEELDGNPNVAALTLSPPIPSTVDEGQVWVLSGQVVDAGGTGQSISLTVNWNDGTGAQTYTIQPAPLTSMQLGFGYSRSGNTSSFTLSKNLNDQASGTVNVTAQGSATATASIAYAARNVAPTIQDASIDECADTNPCVLTPGDTVTVRGTLTDPGVLDDPVVTVGLFGETPVNATVTEGRLVRITALAAPQTPMPWNYVAQVRLPDTGRALASFTITADDGDGGVDTMSFDVEQYVGSLTPETVTAAAAGPDAIDVSFTYFLPIGGTLPLTWVAECASTDGEIVESNEGNSPIRVPGLVPGKTYSCKVFTRSAVTDGPSLAAANVTLRTGIPDAPSGLAAVRSGSGVEVTWTDASVDETSFEVQRARLVGTQWSEWVSWSIPADSTSYTDSSVAPGDYAYLVRARSGVGDSGWQIVRLVVSDSTSPPSAPTALAATATGATVDLTWTDTSSDEFGFELLRARYDGSAWTDWTSFTAAADAGATTDTPSADGRYAYLVRSYNPAGSSARSDPIVVEVSTATAAPSAPTGLTIFSNWPDVQLNWNDSDTETAYELLRAKFENGAWGAWTLVSVLDAGATVAEDNVPSAGRYAYVLRARNAIGVSDWVVAVASVPTQVLEPPAPSGLAATRTATGVSLTWTDESNFGANEDAFEIQRAELIGDTWTNLTSFVTGNDVTSLDDPSAPAGTLAYLIRSTNPLGSSEWVTVVV